jgi:hypothetical protein
VQRGVVQPLLVTLQALNARELLLKEAAEVALGAFDGFVG